MPKNKSFLWGSVTALFAGLVTGIPMGYYVCVLRTSGFFCKKHSSFSCEIKERKSVLFLNGARFLDVRDFGDHAYIGVFRSDQAIASISVDGSNPSKGVTGMSVMMDNKKEGKQWCDVINCDFSDEGEGIEFSKRPHR